MPVAPGARKPCLCATEEADLASSPVSGSADSVLPSHYSSALIASHFAWVPSDISFASLPGTDHVRLNPARHTFMRARRCQIRSQGPSPSTFSLCGVPAQGDPTVPQFPSHASSRPRYYTASMPLSPRKTGLLARPTQMSDFDQSLRRRADVAEGGREYDTARGRGTPKGVTAFALRSTIPAGVFGKPIPRN